ncbi:phage tail protein [Brevundimonas sp.]|uniref:phage tail protein n=1 Tax=Brevundimonas sp. TaxID=1871086 RepID=UPI002AB9F306|nr:tail fiber protein [Brevundimonas sp.]MDZ4363861.1 tail fiber protein [Brevundimonas sp.]
MSDYFVGEIRAFAFGQIPQGWHLADGTTLPVNQYAALYSLLGNVYGGTPSQTFALPDLRGRVPVDVGTAAGATYALGAKTGTEGVVLTVAQLPPHQHELNATTTVGNTGGAGGNAIATVNQDDLTPPQQRPLYAAPGTLQPLLASSVGSTGSGGAHPNIQPSTVVNYCIALTGIYPPRQ